MDENKEMTPAPLEEELLTTDDTYAVYKAQQDGEVCTLLGEDESIRVDYTVDFDTAMEGLELAAKTKLYAQRGLQTIALGIVALWFLWPAVTGSGDLFTSLLAALLIVVCIYFMFAVWRIPKKNRLKNAKAYDEKKTPCTFELFQRHVTVREGEETTVFEYDNKTWHCYETENILLFIYNKLDIVILPKSAMGEELPRIQGILKARLVDKYQKRYKGAQTPFERLVQNVKRKFGKQ